MRAFVGTLGWGALACGVAAACSPLASAAEPPRAEESPPATARHATLGAALDALAKPLEAALSGATRSERRLAVIALGGPERLATALTARLTESLRGAEGLVLDRSWSDALRATEREIRPADLMALLGCPAVVTGHVAAHDGGASVVLRVLDRDRGETYRAEVGLSAGEVEALATPAAPPQGMRRRGPIVSAPLVSTRSAPLVLGTSLVVQRKLPDGSFTPPANFEPGEPLREGDRFRLFVVPSRTCRLQIIAFEDGKAPRRVLPRTAGGVEAPAGVPVGLPPSGSDRWYEVQRAPGRRAGEVTRDEFFIVGEVGPGPGSGAAAEAVGPGPAEAPDEGLAEPPAAGAEARPVEAPAPIQGEHMVVLWDAAPSRPGAYHEALTDSAVSLLETRLHLAVDALQQGQPVKTVVERGFNEVDGPSIPGAALDASGRVKLTQIGGSERAVIRLFVEHR